MFFFFLDLLSVKSHLISSFYDCGVVCFIFVFIGYRFIEIVAIVGKIVSQYKKFKLFLSA